MPSIPRAGNVWHKILFKRSEFRPAELFPSNLAYFDDFYQWSHVCLFLTQYFAQKLKSKAFFERKYRVTRRRWSLYLTTLISSYLFCIIWQRHKINLKKIATRSIFTTDIRTVLLRYWRKKYISNVIHKIDNFPGKIALWKKF